MMERPRAQLPQVAQADEDRDCVGGTCHSGVLDSGVVPRVKWAETISSSNPRPQFWERNLGVFCGPAASAPS